MACSFKCKMQNAKCKTFVVIASQCAHWRLKNSWSDSDLEFLVHSWQSNVGGGAHDAPAWLSLWESCQRAKPLTERASSVLGGETPPLRKETKNDVIASTVGAWQSRANVRAAISICRLIKPAVDYTAGLFITKTGQNLLRNLL